MKITYNILVRIMTLGVAILLIPSVQLFAKATNPKISKTAETMDAKFLKEVSRKYKSENILRIPIEKTITSELKASSNVSTGILFYSAGKIRWEISTPEKSLLVFNGKTLFNVNYASPDFPGKNKVTRSAIDKKNKAQLILIDILALNNLSKSFEISKNEEDESQISFELTPNTHDLILSQIALVINKSPKYIKTLSYKDDIGNLTVLKLEEPKKDLSKALSIFNYKPSKNDDVTDL